MSVVATWADGSTETYADVAAAFDDITAKVRANVGLPVQCEFDGVAVSRDDVRAHVMLLLGSRARGGR